MRVRSVYAYYYPSVYARARVSVAHRIAATIQDPLARQYLIHRIAVRGVFQPLFWDFTKLVTLCLLIQCFIIVLSNTCLFTLCTANRLVVYYLYFLCHFM